MNKQLSVMGLAARASMVPVLIVSGLTALAVGALTYLANPEHTGGAAGVGAAPLAAAVGCLMVMVMLCLGGCGFGSQTLRPLPLRLTQAVIVRQQRFRQHSLPGFVPEPVQCGAGSRSPLGKQCAASQARYGQQCSCKHACRCQQRAIIQKHWNGFFAVCRAACQQQSRAERAHRHPDLR